MQADPTSRRIRAVFVAMLVLGLALRAMQASALFGPDGMPALEVDLQALAYTSWALTAVSILGWVMVLFGVRNIALRGKRGGPLRVTLWCWGIALALDFLWIVLVATEMDSSPLMEWSDRLMTMVITAGAVASIIHARDGGADSKLLSISGFGLLLYVAVLVALEFQGFFGAAWFWGAWVLSAFAPIGLMSAMAVLPWTPVGGEELASDAVETGLTVKDGSASTDFIVGALFLGGGAALTYLSMTGGGIGGRAVLAWGPMLYGIYRIVRGFTR